MSRDDQLARLRAALAGLREVATLIQDGRSHYDGNEDRRRALAYVWITVGSALKDYARVAGVSSGEPPYSSVARFRDRLAHQALDRLDVEIMWDTSVNRTSTLTSWVEPLLVALEGAEPDQE